MAVFSITVPLFHKSVENEVEVVLPHAIQYFLEPSHPTERLLCDHHICFRPIFSDLFRGVKNFAIRPLEIYSVLLSPPAVNHILCIRHSYLMVFNVERINNFTNVQPDF